MKIFDWLHSTCSAITNAFANTGQNAHPFSDQNRINPASSLPMNGSVDIHGNTFGAGSSISHDLFSDQHRYPDHSNHHTSSFNDYHNHHTHYNHHDSLNNSSFNHDYHDSFRNY